MQWGNFENVIGMFSGFQKSHRSDTLHMRSEAPEFLSSVNWGLVQVTHREGNFS